MTEAKWFTRPTNLLLAVVLLLSLGAALLMATPARAQPSSWPGPVSWIQIDSDPNEAGGQNYRDVIAAYFYFDPLDPNYLWLRLQTVAAAQITGVASRFKWFFDTGVGSNLHFSGQNILGTEFLLFVEDWDNVGGGEIYLLAASPDDRFGAYEPSTYRTNPGQAATSDAGYQLSGNYVDMYVRLGALGVPDLTHLSLTSATDQENPNLEQGPILDSADAGDTPIRLDADLGITKTVSDSAPSAGDTITYTIAVTNSGPATATNVEITDSLPDGVTYQSHSASQGTYNSGSGIWLLGDLANAASATLTVTVDVDSPNPYTTITNTAAITAVDQPDPDPYDNSDSVDIFLVGQPPNDADLAIIKTVCACIPKIGDTIIYTVTVTNSGPSSATNIEITDSLPDGIDYESDSASQGTYSSNTDIWLVGTLANAASATLTITGIVAPCPCGSTITNTATISAVDQNDPDLGDNSDSTVIFPYRTAARGVPAFPSLYVGIAAVLAAGTLAYFVRKRVVTG
jgi:uncharacterized repeat protein (TIGR01451 family)